jgi:hypothetical protein
MGAAADPLRHNIRKLRRFLATQVEGEGATLVPFGQVMAMFSVLT